MRPAAWLLLLAGCTPDTGRLPLASIDVRWARLEKVDLGGMTMLGGGGGGGAELLVGSTAGETYIVPVSLSYASAGLLLDLSISSAGATDLVLPRETIRGDALFGTYKGSREGLVVLVGAVGRHLQNEAGVRIDDTSLAIGFSVLVAAEWLTVNPDLQLVDTGTAPYETGTTEVPIPTGDTGETATTPGTTGETGP